MLMLSSCGPGATALTSRVSSSDLRGCAGWRELDGRTGAPGLLSGGRGGSPGAMAGGGSVGACARVRLPGASGPTFGFAPTTGLTDGITPTRGAAAAGRAAAGAGLAAAGAGLAATGAGRAGSGFA